MNTVYDAKLLGLPKIEDPRATCLSSSKSSRFLLKSRGSIGFTMCQAARIEGRMPTRRTRSL